MFAPLTKLLGGTAVPDQALRERMVFGTGRTLFLLLLVSAALYQVSAPGVSSAAIWASTFGLACLVFLGAFAISTLPGFLFALPRMLSSDAAGTVRDRRLRPGNLEDVADWLTKILLGIGLTQINGLPSRLWNWSIRIGEAGFGSHRYAPAVLLLALAGSSLGFLFAYLATRMKINRILVEEDSAVQERYDTAVKVLNSSSAAPVSDKIEQDVKTSASAQKAAAEVAEKRFEEMQSRDEKLAWARAQVLLHRWKDAAHAFEAILRTYPDDQQAAQDYIRALYQAGDFRTARDVEARFQGTRAATPADTVEHQLDRMLSLLYEPKGYEEALKIGAGLARDKTAASQPRYWLYMAAAYGQQHKALRNAASPREELERVRNSALAAVRKLKEIDKAGDWLDFVRGLVDPSSVPGHPDREDDLTDFRDDPEFRAEVGLTGRGH